MSIQHCISLLVLLLLVTLTGAVKDVSVKPIEYTEHTDYPGYAEVTYSHAGYDTTPDNALPTTHDDFPVGLVIGFPAVGIAVIISIAAGFILYRKYKKGQLRCFQRQKRVHAKQLMEAGNYSTKNGAAHSEWENGDTTMTDCRELQPSYPGTAFVEIDINDTSDELDNARRPSQTIRENRTKSDRETVIYDNQKRSFSIKTTIANEKQDDNGIESTDGKELPYELKTLKADQAETPAVPSDNRKSGVEVSTWITRLQQAGTEAGCANDGYDQDDDEEYVEMVVGTRDHELERSINYCNYGINQERDNGVEEDDSTGKYKSSNKFDIHAERRFLSQSMINERAPSEDLQNNHKRAMTVRRPPRLTPRQSKHRETFDPYEYPPGIPILSPGRSNNADNAGIYVDIVNKNVPDEKSQRVSDNDEQTEDKRDGSAGIIHSTSVIEVNAELSEDIVYDYPPPRSDGPEDSSNNLNVNKDEIPETEDIYDYPRDTSYSSNTHQSSTTERASPSVLHETRDQSLPEAYNSALERSMQDNTVNNDTIVTHGSDIDEKEDDIYQVPKSVRTADSDMDEKEDDIYPVPKSVRTSDSDMDEKQDDIYQVPKSVRTADSDMDEKQDDIYQVPKSVRTADSDMDEKQDDIYQVPKSVRTVDSDNNDDSFAEDSVYINVNFPG